MATTSNRRTQVEALDALTAEVRLANQIAVLALGATALEHETRVTDASRARVERRNMLRKDIRVGLGIVAYEETGQ